MDNNFVVHVEKKRFFVAINYNLHKLSSEIVQTAMRMAIF